VYRDEKESLRAENERLKEKLAEKRRRGVPWAAVVLALFAVGAFFLLQPWLNGSDIRFWAALGILLLLAGGAVFAAVRQT